MNKYKIKPICKGRLVSLTSKKVKLPNGNIVNIDIVVHPGAALVVPFLTKEKIIILRQFRPVINSYIYELPAGTVKKQETAIACAQREIVEETGYSARKFTRLGEIYPVPGYSTEKIVIFKAKGLKKSARYRIEKDEIIEHIIVDRAKVRMLFKNGELTDAKTISALSMCGWL